MTRILQFPTSIFDQVANTYDSVSALPCEVGKQLLGRLTGFEFQPTALLDLGCGTGRDLKVLNSYYPKAQCIGVDLSGRMLQQARRYNQFSGWKKWKKQPHWVCAESQALPFCSQQFDLIYANLSLAWVSDFHRTLTELQRLLKPQGLILFSLLGSDTLTELTKLQPEYLKYPWALQEMHEVGDALVAAKFTQVVLDVDLFRLHYAHFSQFQTEMHQLGFYSLFSSTHDLIHPPSGIHAMKDPFATTWEVIYGHARGGRSVPRATNPALPSSSEITIPIPSIRRQAAKQVSQTP